MTREELAQGLSRRRLGDTARAVIVVKNHKTGGLSIHHTELITSFVLAYFFTGRKEAAILVADATSVQMALLWLKLLERTFPDCTLAFPDFDGQPLQHLERKVDAAARSIGHTLPTATSFRKHIEIRNKRLSGPMREAVSRALSHSLATAQQYYQAPTVSDAYSAYSVMQDIIGGARAASPGKEEGEDMLLGEEEAVEEEEGRKAEEAAPRRKGRDSMEGEEKAECRSKKGKERRTGEGQLKGFNGVRRRRQRKEWRERRGRLRQLREGRRKTVWRGTIWQSAGERRV